MNRKDETFEEIRIKDLSDESTLEDMLTDSMYKLSAMLGYEIADSIESLNIVDLKKIILELIETNEVSFAELQNIFAHKAFVAVMNA